MTQNRLRSKPAWIAIAALIGFILGNYGLYDTIGLTDESYKVLVDLILAVAAAVGVWNNPTDAENW
jgi:uncharacterized membrane protein